MASSSFNKKPKGNSRENVRYQYRGQIRLASAGDADCAPELLQNSTSPSRDLSQSQDNVRQELSAPGPDLSQIAPLNGPSRVVIHSDGNRACLALVITEDLVSKVQRIADNAYKLQQHKKVCSEIETELRQFKRLLKSREEESQTADSREVRTEEDTVALELKVQDALERKEAIERDIDMFKFNLEFARNSSQKFLEEHLGDAGLLDPPPENCVSLHLRPKLPDSSGPWSKPESIAPSPEALLAQAAGEDVYRLMQTFREARYAHDRKAERYAQQWAAYHEYVANGGQPVAVSEVDRVFLRNNATVTQQLIEAQEKYKKAEAHAIALGALSYGWREGDSVGIWCGQSAPAEDLVYILGRSSKDFRHIEAWMEDIPDSEIQSRQDTVDVDDWNAKSIHVGEDSSSVVAGEDDWREEIDLWAERMRSLRDSQDEVGPGD